MRPVKAYFTLSSPPSTVILWRCRKTVRVSWSNQSTFFPDALCCCIEAALPVVSPSRSISASCSEALIRS